MTKILFLCHGNICRSPMAEYMMKDLVRRRGLEGEFFIASAAVSREEIGNDVYPPARRCLLSHGIDCPRRQAVQLTAADYEKYDRILYMEEYNRPGIRRILPEDPAGKIHRLLDLTARPRDVDDPWYTGDFETAYRDIREGCLALLEDVEKAHG